MTDKVVDVFWMISNRNFNSFKQFSSVWEPCFLVLRFGSHFHQLSPSVQTHLGERLCWVLLLDVIHTNWIDCWRRSINQYPFSMKFQNITVRRYHEIPRIIALDDFAQRWANFKPALLAPLYNKSWWVGEISLLLTACWSSMSVAFPLFLVGIAAHLCIWVCLKIG